MKSPRNEHDRGIVAGIVFAAGWLCSAHNEEVLAAELLEAAQLTSSSACLKGGAEQYDVDLARPALNNLRCARRSAGKLSSNP